MVENGSIKAHETNPRTARFYHLANLGTLTDHAVHQLS